MTDEKLQNELIKALAEKSAAKDEIKALKRHVSELERKAAGLAAIMQYKAENDKPESVEAEAPGSTEAVKPAKKVDND